MSSACYKNSHEARVENVGGGAMTKDEPNPLRNTKFSVSETPSPSSYAPQHDPPYRLDTSVINKSIIFSP